MERRTTRITGALGALTAGVIAGIIVGTSLVSAPAAQTAESDAAVTQGPVSASTTVFPDLEDPTSSTRPPVAPARMPPPSQPRPYSPAKRGTSSTRSNHSHSPRHEQVDRHPPPSLYSYPHWTHMVDRNIISSKLSTIKVLWRPPHRVGPAMVTWIFLI